MQVICFFFFLYFSDIIGNYFLTIVYWRIRDFDKARLEFNLDLKIGLKLSELQVVFVILSNVNLL